MRSLNTIICSVSFLLISLAAHSQNLVPNPGFESLISCPIPPFGASQLNLASPWNSLSGDPDVFNSCYANSVPVGCNDVGVPANYAGYAAAHSGQGYAGILVKYGADKREYLSVALTSALIVGQEYHVEFYVRRAKNFPYAVKNIGLAFSVGALTQPPSATNIAVAPDIKSPAIVTDTTAWTLISGTYVAASGVDHITIGNFNDDASTVSLNIGGSNACGVFPGSGFYYIDDVLVEPIIEQLTITGDTVICPGLSTTLASTANVSTYWSLSATPLDTITTSANLTVAPPVTTTYILHGVTKTDTVTVHVIPPPVVNLGKDTSVCELSNFPLGAYNPNSTYQWSTGEATDTIYPLNSGTYWVHVDNGGCIRSDSIAITILTNPKINLGADTIYCWNNLDTLHLDAGPGTGHIWIPSGDTNQIHTVLMPGAYTVIVNHANGCTTTDSIVTYQICPPHIYIPNSFTPNDDQVNDYFLPQGTDIYNVVFDIYNRWGQLIVSAHSSTTGWDGKKNGSPVPEGVYVYKLTYYYYNETGAFLSDTKSGTLSLIR